MDLAGRRDALGMWAGEGDGESAKYRLAVLTELKNRGVADIFSWCAMASMIAGLGGCGVPDTVVETWIIHSIRGTFRYAGASTARPSPERSSRSTPRSMPQLPREASDALDAERGQRYPAAIVVAQRLEWNHPFLDYDAR